MLECFREQLQNSYWKAAVPVDSSIEPAQALRKEVKKVLKKPTDRLLIHLDEHRAMSSDADFRRGALSIWGEMPDLVTVISTYTDLPDIQARGSSSGVCRRPIPKPMFDVSRMMQVAEGTGPDGATERPTTGFPVFIVPTVTDGREKRLLASLRVVLGLAMTQLGLGNCTRPAMTCATSWL